MILNLVVIFLFFNLALADWEKFTNISDVQKRGISGGLYTKWKQDIFVARLLVNDLQEPGKLYLNEPTLLIPVFYYFDFEHEHKQRDVTNVEFYASEETCDYGWVKACNGVFVPNAIEVYQGLEVLYIGRCTYKGDPELGKVLLEPPNNKMIFGYNTAAFSINCYEVLVCNPKPETTTQDPRFNELEEKILNLDGKIVRLQNQIDHCNSEVAEEKDRINVCQQTLNVYQSNMTTYQSIVGECQALINACQQCGKPKRDEI